MNYTIQIADVRRVCSCCYDTARAYLNRQPYPLHRQLRRDSNGRRMAYFNLADVLARLRDLGKLDAEGAQLLALVDFYRRHPNL